MTFKTTALIAFLAVGAWSQTATAPSPPPPGSIIGRVVRASDGVPLKSARLQLAPAIPGKDLQMYTETTDADGNFSFKAVKPGSYYFLARKAGFVRQAYLAKGPKSEGAILTLTPGQEVKDVLFRMMTAAVAIGRIVDELGEPVSGVEVEALAKELDFDDSDADDLKEQQTAVTNDLGEFRLYGLPPGGYYFKAIYSGNPDYTQLRRSYSGADAEAAGKYPPIYYPGVFSESQATQVLLRAGDETHVDFRLQPQRTVTIYGRVLNANGQPALGVVVNLQSREQSFMYLGMRHSFSSADGRFSINKVPVGSYLLTANVMGTDRLESGQQKIEVSGEDLNGLELVLHKPITLKGKITGFPKGAAAKHQVTIILEGGTDSSYVPVKEDGILLAENLLEGIYRLRANLPEGCYIESARLGKDEALKDGLNITPDAADSSLEITVSQSAASLEGTAYDGDNPVPGSVVHLKPSPPNRFHPELAQETVTDQNGHFVFETVTPGSYKAFAQEDTGESSDPPEPDLQKDATSVDLGKNEHKSIRLELIKH